MQDDNYHQNLLEYRVFAFVLMGVWLVFALVYWYLHRLDPKHFQFEDGFMDPMYFSSSTTVSVGDGKYGPLTRTAKAVVIVHHFCITGILVYVVFYFLENKAGKK